MDLICEKIAANPSTHLREVAFGVSTAAFRPAVLTTFEGYFYLLHRWQPIHLVDHRIPVSRPDRKVAIRHFKHLSADLE